MLPSLDDPQKRALERARGRRLSYAVRVVRAPDGRALAILGEVHLKLGNAAAIGRAVVEAFELRGVETFQRKRVFCGPMLGVLIEVPRLLLRLVSLGTIKGSTITEAKRLPSGCTVELERTQHVPFGLHVASLYLSTFFIVAVLALLSPLIAPVAPALGTIIALASGAFDAHMLLLLPAILLRRYSWSWMVHPFVGILTLRDELMAAGAVRMLAEHRKDRTAVVVMGRAHVRGFARVLAERYGFVI